MLCSLHLIEVNLCDVPITALPSSLKSLAITKSYLLFNWFQQLSESGACMPYLVELNLSESSKTSDTDIHHIVRAWPGLTTLKLNSCYRVSSAGLQLVAEGLHHLEVLEIGGTSCDDLAVHHIGCNLAGTLRCLSMSHCLLFTDGCAGSIASLLTNLQVLSVSGCHRLSASGLLSFALLQASLHHLNISMISVNNDSIMQLRNSLPACEIIYTA